MASLLRRASRPKERPADASGASASPSPSPREPERVPSSPLTGATPSPRRASRAKEDDGSFEISELMRQVMDWKHRHQAECEAHQRTRERLRAVETELNALKGLPPPAPDPNEASPPKLTATITIKPLELPVSASPPSAPSSPTTTSSAANASPASAPTTPTGSSPNFFRTTGRQMGRLLAGGGSSSQRGERRLFGVRLEVVMASPSDVPRAVSQALGFVADALMVDDIDATYRSMALGDLKQQVERGATIDFTAGAEGRAKAQQLLFRFLMELPEPLIPVELFPHLASAAAAPAPQLRHRRVYLSLALGLSPVQRGLLDAYVATLLLLVAKSAKTVAAPVSPVNPEAEQLERLYAHLEANIQRVVEAASRQSSPDTLTGAREFAKDVQDFTERADKRISPSSPPSLAAMRNEFSRNAKTAMSALKGVLTASPGVLSVQLGQLKEACDRVKASATALRNNLAPPPPPPPAVDENTELRRKAAVKLAAAFAPAFFGGADEPPPRPSLVKQNSVSQLGGAQSQSPSAYATLRGNKNKAADTSRRGSESGDLATPASPPPAASAQSVASFFGSLSPAAPAAAPALSKAAVLEVLLLEWPDIMAAEKVAVTAVEDARTLLNAAPLDLCIDRMLETVQQDSEFRPLLLRTHVYVLPSEEFLTHLLARYAASPATAYEREVNGSVEALLKTWFNSCMPAAPEPLLQQLRTFAQQTSGALRFLVADLAALSKAACATPPPSLNGEEAAPATPFPGVKLRVDVTLIDVLTRDPEEVAQQLLLIDLELFQAIPVNEFLMGNTAKGRAPFHSRLIDSYNTWARWIGGEVLSVSDAQRVDCIVQAIRIADTCRKIGDFNASFALFCGVSFSSITRLEAVWAKVPRKWMERYEELQELFSSKQDFKKLRSEMKKVAPTAVVVPYTGLYTKWLVAIEENNRTMLESNLVNLGKLRLVYRLCKEIQGYQNRGVAGYLPNPELKRLLLGLKPLSEEQLWEKSLLLLESSTARTARSRGNTASAPDLTAVAGLPTSSSATGFSVPPSPSTPK